MFFFFFFNGKLNNGDNIVTFCHVKKVCGAGSGRSSGGRREGGGEGEWQNASHFRAFFFCVVRGLMEAYDNFQPEIQECK